MKVLTKKEIENLTWSWESFRDLVLLGEAQSMMDTSGMRLSGVLDPSEMKPVGRIKVDGYSSDERLYSLDVSKNSKFDEFKKAHDWTFPKPTRLEIYRHEYLGI